MRDQGRFISLEGGEGAGKSTQAQRLADHLAARGLPVLLTREPGGAPGAEAMRRLLLGGAGLDAVAEALLVFAARRDHLVSTLRPALAAGIWVISDRFVDSTRAYQGHGQGVPAAAIEALAAVALEGQAPDNRSPCPSAIAAAAPGRCAVVDAARPPGAVAAAIASLVDARLP
ncbi:MAG: dTMP kinase [Rhodospirillales bacterium 12-71-4]|nr:MAG: dTMP kinase [Rhodospirillales bacterium 12-71-4]